MINLTDIPLLIRYFFDKFYPVIRRSHSKTVIKTKSSVFYYTTQTRHSTHFLCNSNRIRVVLMYKLICQNQICNGIFVLISVIIIIIGCEIPGKSMVKIKHTGYTIESKTIEMIFIKPELAIRQEEM